MGPAARHLPPGPRAGVKMADLPTAVQITELASLLAPGLIIATIRDRAITGSAPELKDRIFAYGLISTAYFAAVTPLFHVNWGWALPLWWWSFLQYFLVPVVIGVGAAYLYQWRFSYRIAEKFGLHLAHHLPASWDYAFEGRTDGTYILVTMQDGSQIAGRWAKGSFASSSKEERDLYLSEMWEIDEDEGDWTRLNPVQSILICAKDIRYIEFFGV